MKYPGGNSTERFCEQFDTVVSLFDQWNDCERTVVLCALLKRIPYSNLKFLQLSIEHNSLQAYNSQSKLQALESNSNNLVFLNKLLSRYKNFSDTSMGKDILVEEGLPQLEKYDKKEDILHDILTYLPMLKPGNTEAKTIYMNLIPLIVEDSIRQMVSTELVQHIFSYLLIHPGITNEDRRSLSHWLRHLQEHISQGFIKNHISTNTYFMPPKNSVNELTSPYLTSSTSSLSSASWQTVAPPKENTSWDLHSIQVTQEFCDELKSLSNDSGKLSNSSHSSQKYENDDLHVSFSKNGTEILDFDYDEFRPVSKTHVGYECNRDFLTVPGFEQSVVKTRRSNSLTTAMSQNTCSSAENLTNICQKPRSFSLSMESSRGNLTSSGSETRLDEINKPYLRNNTHSVGMSNVGQWLKSLRLHKYVWLFSNLTYEQMLEITEEYLENLGVTKGARHKLVLCIHKLKDRNQVLHQMEKEVLAGVRQLHSVLEELTNIVLTPMKPIGAYANDDVAAQFYKVVDYIATRMPMQQGTRQQPDEDSINIMLWILERSLHNEAFVAQSNQLKEHKYKLSKLKAQYTPKNHYLKGAGANGGMKMRWNNSAKHKGGSTEGLKIHRKNSATMQHYPPVRQSPQSQTNMHPTCQMYYPNSSASVGNKTPYNNKSSSYPNFNNNNNNNGGANGIVKTNSTATHTDAIKSRGGGSGSGGAGVSSNSSNGTGARSSHNELEVAANAISLAYHHHSLNNLLHHQPLAFQGMSQQSSALKQQVDSSIVLNSSDYRTDEKNRKMSDTLSSTKSSEKISNSSIVDINNRLEFLCLQMTEQAIN